MFDEDQIETVDTSLDPVIERATTLREENDPEEEIVTIEQPSLSAAPL